MEIPEDSSFYYQEMSERGISNYSPKRLKHEQHSKSPTNKETIRSLKASIACIDSLILKSAKYCRKQTSVFIKSPVKSHHFDLPQFTPSNQKQLQKSFNSSLASASTPLQITPSNSPPTYIDSHFNSLDKSPSQKKRKYLIFGGYTASPKNKNYIHSNTTFIAKSTRISPKPLFQINKSPKTLDQNVTFDQEKLSKNQQKSDIHLNAENEEKLNEVVSKQTPQKIEKTLKRFDIENLFLNSYENHSNSPTFHSPTSKKTNQNEYKKKHISEDFNEFLKKIEKYDFIRKYKSDGEIYQMYMILRKSKMPQRQWGLFIANEVYKLIQNNNN